MIKVKKIWEKYPIWSVFGIHFLIAALILFPFLILNNGILTLCEDFNSETIPYLYYIHDTIYNKEFAWSWFFDLGGDAIQSLSCIGGFNPTTLLNALMPRKIILYALPYFVMLRYALMGAGSYLYIGRYVKSKKSAFLGSLLYAFSGYSACVLVFNFVNDAFVIFPFVLWSLDGLVLEKRRGLFAVLIAISAIGSPSTLVMEVFFFAVYYLIRFLFEDWKYLKEVSWCILEGILEIGMAAVSFATQVLILLNNNRLGGGKLTGSGALTFSSTNIMLWLRAWLLPGETMSSTTSIVRHDWTSNAAWLPMVGMTLVIAYILKEEKTWLRRMILAEIVISLVPFLNDMFMLEMAYPYRRWYAFGLLIMALASSEVFENINKYPVKKATIIMTVLILLYVYIILFVPWENGKTLEVFYRKRLIARVFLASLGIVLTLLLVLLKKTNNIFVTFVLMFAIASHCLIVWEYKGDAAHKIQDNYTKQVIAELTETGRKLENQKILPYRVVYDNTYYNYGMMHHQPSRTSFISLVSPSIEKFYDLLGVPRGTVSPIGPKGTNALLSVKFYFLSQEEKELSLKNKYNNGVRSVYLYEDLKVPQMGFLYDSYITEEELKDVCKENRAFVALSNLVVSSNDISNVRNVLKHSLLKSQMEEVPSREIQDIEQIKKKENAESFSYDTNGFQTRIATKSSKYAFFSIPYNSNWSATVNGNSVQILDSMGMMAVPVKKGMNEIVFRYDPVEAKIACLCSLVFVFLWGVYNFFVRKYLSSK